jgi:DNA helicase-2/ATP-dependent DNA helicase PcrA
LAGAGSGKTKTLTHRVAYLISKLGIDPNAILAVTFTNKAAGEMRERIAELLGQNPNNRSFMPYLGTFHSVCVRLLRIDGDRVEIPKNFVIFDTNDQVATIRSIMKDLNVDTKQFNPRAVGSMISAAKNEMVDPETYSNLASGPMQKVVAEIYPHYGQALKQSGALDFDDLLLKVVELFSRDEETRQKWSDRFNYILIDEYQDTNTAQYKIAKLLVNKERNICVVGDDWQSIYSWRGADFRNILNFEKDFKGAKVVKLEQNYRSTQEILDAAQSVINKNRQRTDKKIWTHNKGGQPIVIEQTTDEVAEGEYIVRHIKPAVDMAARKYSDYATLYRTNAQSRSLEEVMIRYQIPYQIVGGVRFYDRQEIKDVLAYLRLVYQPNDNASFLRVVNVPGRGIGSTTLADFEVWRQSEGLSLYEGLNQVAISTLKSKAKQGLSKFNEMLLRLREYAAEANAAELIDAVLRRSEYLAYLDDGSVVAQDRIANVKELISVAREYEEQGLASFLEEVALVSDADTYKDKDDTVTLMTLHAAKGLEFPVVFIVGLEESMFPHSRALFDASEMEEERRLCYVGMTRAKEELYLLFATRRLLYGGVQHNPPSRFLSEIDGSFGVVTPHKTSEERVVYDEEPLAEIQVEVGDKVEHQVFGRGTIEAVEGDVVVVKFAGRGSKRLNIAFAPLRKI